MSRMTRLSTSIAALTASAMLLVAPAANAQKWVMSGVTQLSSGVEGGGGRTTAMERAQTRMRIGADLFVDERPEDIFGVSGLIGIEPRTSFGIDARYTRVVDNKYAFSAGGIAYLQPGSMVGPVAAAEYRMPMSKNFIMTMGPEANVFIIGTDVPDRTVIWQALFQVGVRVGL